MFNLPSQSIINGDFCKHAYAFIISQPWAANNSNGISIMLEIAEEANKMGLDCVVVPGHSLSPSNENDFNISLNINISWSTPLNCVAIICDTIDAERLQEVRKRAHKICHYSLAPKGLFQVPGGGLVVPMPREASAVYSPQVSTKLKVFYFQKKFRDLEIMFNQYPGMAKPLSIRDENKKSRLLDIAVYAGKGRLRPLHEKYLANRINCSKLKTITRKWPASKKKLYNILANSDLLVSFDPISSINHESILLGTPVLVVPPWDETEFVDKFPVSLEGISWGSFSRALDYLENGYDLENVRRSYFEAIGKNSQVLMDFFRFASGNQMLSHDCELETSYWENRQLFFRALDLPSFYESDSWPGIRIFSEINYRAKIYEKLLLRVKAIILLVSTFASIAYLAKLLGKRLLKKLEMLN